MPLYYFTCESCGAERRRLLKPQEASQDFECECGGRMVRSPRAPTTRAVERLDNGIMPKLLERPADAERLFAERARQGRNND